ncbi:hypothetical protein BDW74DRAFT_144781 [Aspergillus multicolor]|uniref:uncharacterized protein n=1 Tax=Aspergillus multicolor TaxID=41759 RepID=UPI003CCDC9BA
MEQRILSMEAELQDEYGNKDWTMSFRAGPDSIGILAECILITSRPKVIGIELKGPGLKYDTLSANVNNCASVGADTFRRTARNMQVLAHLTNELSRPNGIIEKMLKFCEPGQSAARDRMLPRDIAKGEEHVASCTNLINEISASFNAWCEVTKALYGALKQTRGQKSKQEEEVKNEIHKREVDRELREEQRRKEEARAEEMTKAIEKAREKKERFESLAAPLVSGSGLAEGGLAAVATSTGAVVFAGVGFVVAGATAFILYRNLKADLMSMEEAQERRDREIRELEASKANLEMTLTKLSAESKSIKNVAKIIETSFEKVTELQQLVQNLMSFLGDINKIITTIVKDSKFVYDTAKDDEVSVDLGLKKELLENAPRHENKIHFRVKDIELLQCRLEPVHPANSRKTPSTESHVQGYRR